MVPSDLPLVSQIDSHRSIDMCLQTPRHVMETSIEINLARPQLAHSRHVLNSFIDFIPCGEIFVGRRRLRSLYRLVPDNERIKLDDFAMTVKHVDGELAGDMGGDRGDVGVNRFLLHDGGVGWRFLLSREDANSGASGSLGGNGRYCYPSVEGENIVARRGKRCQISESD